ncbi:MAG: hybrid sensor histidine kinase/response regulator [Planctomycetota bacterium]
MERREMEGRIGKPKVLIVDDFPTNVSILEELLADDFETRSAASGEAALETLAWFRPDIVLLDIMMPGIDGYEVCRRIRRLDDCRFTKVLLVSAKAMLEERLAGYEAGADDYLVKPFDAEELLSKVRAHLRLKAAEEVDALKNDILALLANDACTPLRGILAPAETLRSADHLPGDARQRLGELVYKSAVDLEEYFRAAVALCALRSKKKRLRTAREDLSGILRVAVETLRPKASLRSVSIFESYADDLSVAADKDALAQAFADIIERLVRSSRAGAALRVSASRGEREVSATIAAEGPTPPTESLRRAFEVGPWEELDASEDPEPAPARTALALPLAREVVLAHGGQIDVAADERRGPAFTVRLPRAVPPQA